MEVTLRVRALTFATMVAAGTVACGTILSADGEELEPPREGGTPVLPDGASLDAPSDAAASDGDGGAACKGGKKGHRLATFLPDSAGGGGGRFRFADGSPPMFAVGGPSSGGTRSALPFAGHFTTPGADDVVATFDGPASGGFLFRLFAMNAAGSTSKEFRVGSELDLPLAGEWQSDGLSRIGLYRPMSGHFFLWRALDPAAGGTAADLEMFFPASERGMPIAGDWDCDGSDGVGVYLPVSDTAGTFLLANKLIHSPGVALMPDVTMTVTHPAGAVIPVAGDWDGDGRVTVGLFLPDTGAFYLTNENKSATLVVETPFASPASGEVPVSGRW